MGILPPVATRLERVLRVVLLGCVLGALGVWVLVRPRLGTGLWPAGAYLSLMIVIAANLLAWALARGRGRRFIERMDRRLCPRCLYDLRDAEPVGRCPECGRPYSPVSLEDAWARAYALRYKRRAD